MDYILNDSGAKALFASNYLGETLDQLQSPVTRYIIGGERAGWNSLRGAVADMPTTPVADERAGTDMLYSSGTTGQPKGVRFPLPEDPDIAAANALIGPGDDGVQIFRRQHLSVACAALSCRAFALVRRRFTGSAAPWS